MLSVGTGLTIEWCELNEWKGTDVLAWNAWNKAKSMGLPDDAALSVTWLAPLEWPWWGADAVDLSLIGIVKTEVSRFRLRCLARCSSTSLWSCWTDGRDRLVCLWLHYSTFSVYYSFIIEIEYERILECIVFSKKYSGVLLQLYNTEERLYQDIIDPWTSICNLYQN